MKKPDAQPDAPAAADPGEDLIALVLADQAVEEDGDRGVTAPARIDGVVVGVLAAVRDDGALVVDHPLLRAPLAARSVVALGSADAGCELAIVFEGGDPAKPVVMGRMYVPAAAPAESPELESAADVVPGDAERVRRDGERVEIEAEREIVLRCGNASITLTRAGRIILRGAYVLSRSSGVNRIQGGSVEIN